MKMIVTAIALLSFGQSFASMTTLAKGDLAISRADAQLASVKTVCPTSRPGRMTCQAYGSVVTLGVSLNGCLDRLGGVSTLFEVVEGKGILYVSALNISTEKSKTARCIVRPVKTVQVPVAFEGEIEVKNLDFTATK